MTKYKSEFLNIMHERGFVHQCSDFEGLDKKLKSGVQSAYIGYDPTGTSLHVGHLYTVMMLHWFQQAGHKPISLMGGGTALIPDPTLKDKTRPLLTPEEINKNIEGIKGVFGKFLKYGSGPTDAIMVNNYDWLSKLDYIGFLRDIGLHFTINRMLTFDSVKLRLDREQPLTFLEFNYMILQAYDFLELSRRVGCRAQFGGSDQWGNIVNGIELGRRIDGRELYGVTTPLITTADGSKMGKTAQGAVWLDEALLSPYDYWQFWRNAHDGDVGRFLKLFTDLSLEDIGRLESLGGAEVNQAKIVLATEATAMLHGREAALTAEQTASETFAGGAGEDLPTLSLGEGMNIVRALTALGFTPSNKEAKRKIAEGAVRVDDVVVNDPGLVLTPRDQPLKISLGKKRHALLVK
jgi:tyrosyl-tRNA synthetase